MVRCPHTRVAAPRRPEDQWRSGGKVWVRVYGWGLGLDG
ncbi:hypothetical protein LINPERHAP1_LOCUS26964 [Linum perenne]